MKIEIKPTEKPEKLKENLEKRAESVERDGDKVIAKVENPELIEKVPGIDKYWINGEEHEGLKGRPIQEQAYAKIKSRKDLAKAFLATMDGYDLRILETFDEWDLKLLKRFNPDIKEIKSDEPAEALEIEKALFPEEGLQEIEIELDDEETGQVIDYMMH
ncbi:MAG: hypothetical protein ABEK00_01915 [Candidatus Nanohaloarchaea archaeon]